jgi:anthranilate phosphoribosyltransferase
MHQLSFNHDFARPSTGQLHQISTVAPGGSSPTTGAVATITAAVMAAVGIHHDVDGNDQEPCPAGCGDHSLMVTCVLALTLLVVAWRLPTPGFRCLRQSTVGRQRKDTLPVGRRRPALSLVELSLRRT